MLFALIEFQNGQIREVYKAPEDYCYARYQGCGPEYIRVSVAEKDADYSVVPGVGLCRFYIPQNSVMFKSFAEVLDTYEIMMGWIVKEIIFNEEMDPGDLTSPWKERWLKQKKGCLDCQLKIQN